MWEGLHKRLAAGLTTEGNLPHLVDVLDCTLDFQSRFTCEPTNHKSTSYCCLVHMFITTY